MRFFASILTVSLGAACGSRDVPIEHIKHNVHTDQFDLGVTHVDSFLNKYAALGDDYYSPNIEQLQGGHIVIRGGGRLLMNVCAQADARTISRDQFYRLGIITEPAPVNINYNIEPNGIVRATDHDSLVMMTAYVNFDSVSQFYREVLGDTSRATNTRAGVAYYGEIALGCDLTGTGRFGVSIPLATVDNAVYVGTADMFIVLREADNFVGLELGTNPGVAAHEFGHRIFQQNVYASDSAFRLLAEAMAGDGAPCIDETPDDDVDDCKASLMLLKGMDEGTADILAYTHTGVPDFYFGRSLPPVGDNEPNETKLRDLSRSPVFDGLEVPVFSPDIAKLAATNDLQYYRLGTLWSRGFYAAIVDPLTGAPPSDEAERNRFAREWYAPAIIRMERRLGEDFIATDANGRPNYRFDPRQLLRRYVDEVSRDPQTGAFNGGVNQAICQQLCNRFGAFPFDTPLNGAAAQCAGFIGENNHVDGAFPCQL